MENNMEKSMKNEKKNSTMNSTDFTNRMSLLRKQKGWSQEDLAEKLGVSRQTVSKWELGVSKPKMSKIIEMSKLYNLTTDELINGKDESKPVEIETKVVSEGNTEIILKDVAEINTEVTTVEGEKVNKKKSFLRKHLRKIIIILGVILLVVYLSFSVYKFCILKEINDKFDEYKNVNNCYLERKEIVTNNETGTAYILNERYWYKDGLIKIENIKTEDGITNIVYDYIDTKKEERYMIYENAKKIIKKKNIDEYEKLNNGILEYTLKENYYKRNIDVIKASLNIFESINIKGDKYIKKSNTSKGNVQRIYNRNNAFIEQSYTSNNSEEIKILYNIEIGIVKDEDVEINYMDLIDYKVIEQ